MATLQERRAQVRRSLGIDVPVRMRVLPRMNALPTPGAGKGVLVAPYDDDVLELHFENVGTAAVYLRDGDQPNVDTTTSFILVAGVAWTPAFPFANPVWAAGDAGHDLRIAVLVIDWALRRDK